MGKSIAEKELPFATVPWYPDATQYELFRSAADDPEVFFDSHQDWLITALEHERQAERRGVIIVRVRMRFDAFKRWCAQLPNRKNDLSGRSMYADCCGRDLLTGSQQDALATSESDRAS